jgi:8-oxo-dGTP pyrophosphatase MutT (NUDIX family)
VAEFVLHVEVGPADIGILRWSGHLDSESLQQALSAAADDALAGRGLRRLEVAVPAPDPGTRRAVLRSGFRLEGVRRQAVNPGEGAYADVWLFARLSSDQVGGPHGFSGVMNSTLPRKRLIAHVLIRDPAGRVLLCDTYFKHDWELPGGIVEPGEPPRHGAIREVREELGIDLPLGPLLVTDWLPPYLGWDDALEMIFDGGQLGESDLPNLVLQPTEIRQVRFCTLDEAAALLTPLAHRRLSVAARLERGRFAYLEDGRVVGDAP